MVPKKRQRTYTLPQMYQSLLASSETQERFWKHVEKTEGCWLWKSYTLPFGHGRFFMKFSNGAWHTVLAHRVAYMLIKGIPEQQTLDHRCKVSRCVNPAHLEDVSMRENLMRGTSPSAKHAKVTHCPSGHPYSEENTYYRTHLGRSWRSCRTCVLAKQDSDRRRKGVPIRAFK